MKTLNIETAVLEADTAALKTELEAIEGVMEAFCSKYRYTVHHSQAILDQFIADRVLDVFGRRAMNAVIVEPSKFVEIKRNGATAHSRDLGAEDRMFFMRVNGAIAGWVYVRHSTKYEIYLSPGRFVESYATLLDAVEGLSKDFKHAPIGGVLNVSWWTARGKVLTQEELNAQDAQDERAAMKPVRTPDDIAGDELYAALCKESGIKK